MGIERGLIYFYGYLAYYLGGWGLGSILFSFKFYIVNFENIRIQYEVISNKNRIISFPLRSGKNYVTYDVLWSIFN